LIAQCVPLASEMEEEEEDEEDSMAPKLSPSVALLSLGFNDILIEVGEDVIGISVHEKLKFPQESFSSVSPCFGSSLRAI